MPRSKVQHYQRTIVRVLNDHAPSDARHVLAQISELGLDTAGLRLVAAASEFIPLLLGAAAVAKNLPSDARAHFFKEWLETPKVQNLYREVRVADFKLNEIDEFGRNSGGRPRKLNLAGEDVALMREVARLRRGRRRSVLGACKRLAEKQTAKYGRDFEAIRRRYRRAAAISKR